MPDYRIRASGEVVTDLARAFPNISIPQPPTLADLDALGVDPILEGPQPTLTRFQSAVRSGPTEINGQWFWEYSAVDWDPDAIAAATEKQWDAVRGDRNKRLLDSDWTQLPDAPLTEEQKTAWQAYRQALRDVTQQADPFEIIWPSKPE
jgi:hypothetical protein